MKTNTPIIFWFRQDLRLEDNPGLWAACREGRPLIAVYIWSPEEEGHWPYGAASQWWLHHSLEALMASGVQLIIRQGPALSVLQDLIKESGADAVYWNRRYEPWAIKRDANVERSLRKSAIDAQTFNSALLFEPYSIFNKRGKPFQVFTPFWSTCLKQLPLRKSFGLSKITPFTKSLKTLPLAELGLLPKIHWDKGIAKQWRPGEVEALKVLRRFLDNDVQSYAVARDFPALDDSVSHLSPYLHFGEISPVTVWSHTEKHPHSECYLRQLGWREFAHHLLVHFPHTTEKPLRVPFENFPWIHDQAVLNKWQKGMTGYPFVDAGMRQLWTTGWMHNRVRMVVGSFLVKHLLLSWVEGEKWFWDTLVDADAANNCMGWQWVAGSGADAAPYFRIFNPITQGEKFDPEGEYVRKWVPELAKLPNTLIHKPWEATYLELREADIELGRDYPYPIVDHAKARERALKALKSI